MKTSGEWKGEQARRLRYGSRVPTKTPGYHAGATRGGETRRQAASVGLRLSVRGEKLRRTAALQMESEPPYVGCYVDGLRKNRPAPRLGEYGATSGKKLIYSVLVVDAWAARTKMARIPFFFYEQI